MGSKKSENQSLFINSNRYTKYLGKTHKYVWKQDSQLLPTKTHYDSSVDRAALQLRYNMQVAKTNRGNFSQYKLALIGKVTYKRGVGQNAVSFNFRNKSLFHLHEQ